MDTIIAAVLSAIVLAAVHVVTPSLRFLRGTPRSIWLSIAGGVSVAYVFVHLLPELAKGQQRVSEAVRQLAEGGGGLFGVGFAERHVYLIALVGLAIFYGLDKLAKRSRARRSEGHDEVASFDIGPRSTASRARVRESHFGRDAGTEREASTGPGVFWVHMASFGIYNALIGYLLLHREVPGVLSLVFFAVAMGLHFVVTDFGLDEDHRSRYRSIGRWLLAASLWAGVAVAALTELSEALIAVLVAFLAGGVILNVLKEEVPSERQSRFWAFGLGLGLYALLLLTF